jgi:hypothetical protein
VRAAHTVRAPGSRAQYAAHCGGRRCGPTRTEASAGTPQRTDTSTRACTTTQVSKTGQRSSRRASSRSLALAQRPCTFSRALEQAFALMCVARERRGALALAPRFADVPEFREQGGARSAADDRSATRARRSTRRSARARPRAPRPSTPRPRDSARRPASARAARARHTAERSGASRSRRRCARGHGRR